MAGIFGIAVVANHNIPNKELLCNITMRLMSSTGGSISKSSGLAITTKKEINVIKNTVDANTFGASKSVRQLLKDKVHITGQDKIISIIGHCHTVLPKDLCETDIHPAVCNNIVGVHSGYASNHVDLFRAYGVKRVGTYHGEVAFSIINHLYGNYRTDCAQPISKAVATTCKVLSGSSILSFVCKRDPYVLWLACCATGLFISYYKEIGLLVFSERSRSLREVENGWNLGEYEAITLRAGRLIGINLFSGTMSNKSFESAQHV